MPRLIDDWRRVLTRAWSVRLIALALLLQGIDIVLQITVGQMLEVSWRLRLAAAASGIAALGARLLMQRSLGHGDE